MQREALSLGVSVIAVLWLSLAGCDGRPDGGEPIARLEAGHVDWEVPDGFTLVASVRVLRSGRVIISDPREQRLVSAAPGESRTQPVARRGRGPREWSNAVALEPLSGDSSIQLDPVARRWLVYDGSTIVSEVALDLVATLAKVGMARHALGPASVIALAGPRSAESADSGTIMRLDLCDSTLAPVARVSLAPGRTVFGTGASASVPVAISRAALAVDEEAIGFPDGWLAVIRLDPYRVEWRRPDGSRVLGRVVTVRPRPIGREERAAYLKRNELTLRNIEKMPSPMRETLHRRVTDLPATMPVFINGESIAGGDSRLYVRRRTSLLEERATYDVFDRSGQLVAVLELGPNERLVATTVASAFVVRADADGLERVRRHAWRGP